MDLPPVKVRCTCRTCGKKWNLWTAIGRSDICDPCGDLLREILFGEKLTRNPVFGIVQRLGKRGL